MTIHEPRTMQTTGIDLDRSDEVLHLQISFLILRYEGELMA